MTMLSREGFASPFTFIDGTAIFDDDDDARVDAVVDDGYDALADASAALSSLLLRRRRRSFRVRSFTYKALLGVHAVYLL